MPAAALQQEPVLLQPGSWQPDVAKNEHLELAHQCLMVYKHPSLPPSSGGNIGVQMSPWCEVNPTAVPVLTPGTCNYVALRGEG